MYFKNTPTIAPLHSCCCDNSRYTQENRAHPIERWSPVNDGGQAVLRIKASCHIKHFARLPEAHTRPSLSYLQRDSNDGSLHQLGQPSSLISSKRNDQIQFLCRQHTLEWCFTILNFGRPMMCMDRNLRADLLEVWQVAPDYV